MQSVKRKVRCPACGRLVEWSEANKFRPFCSARCKGIDLGAWASESYRIPGTAREADDNLRDDLPREEKE